MNQKEAEQVLVEFLERYAERREISVHFLAKAMNASAELKRIWSEVERLEAKEDEFTSRD